MLAPPDATERADLALEIRVRWGADLLFVHHLAPPRRFLLGASADADLVVDSAAPDVPLVEVDRTGAVRVTPPPGASGVLRSPDRCDPIEPGAAIDLAPGATVALTLPAPSSPPVYRTAGGQDAPAPVSVELALVRAGRVVGRDLSLRGTWGLLAAVAGAALLAFLFFAAQPLFAVLDGTGSGLRPPDDGPTAEQLQHIKLVLAPIVARELAEQAEREQAQAREREQRERLEQLRQFREVGILLPPPEWHLAEPPLDGRPFEAPVEFLSEALSRYCGPAELDGPEPDFGGSRVAFCRSPVLSPFGLRELGVPSGPDVLGRDPLDLWIHQHARAASHLARTLRHVAIEPGSAFRAPNARMAAAIRREVGACFAFAADPRREATVTIEVREPSAGPARGKVTDGTARTLDPVVLRCLEQALDPIRPALPGSRTPWSTLRLRVLPAAALRAPRP